VSERRYRPLGLSIAILMTVVVYGLYPLIWLWPSIWSAIRSQTTGRYVDPMFDFVGGTWGQLSIFTGVCILIAAVFAWRGRTRGARFGFLGFVWLATAFQLLRTLQGIQPTGVPLANGEAFVGGNIEGVLASVLLCQLPFILFLPLYVTWYLNRAPARRFYGES